MQNTRRNFLKKTFLTTAICVFYNDKIFAKVIPQDTLLTLSYDLFPLSHKLKSNSREYFNIILAHSRIRKDYKKFILNGVKWLNEEAIKIYGKVYESLDEPKRQEVLKAISKENWGENYIYTMLTYILESVLGDPIYNINQNELGWEWLEFNTGFPQPKKAFL